MPNIVLDTTTDELYNSAVDLNIFYQSGSNPNRNLSASGVSLGNGIVLTAAHNFIYSNDPNYVLGSPGNYLANLSAAPNYIVPGTNQTVGQNEPSRITDLNLFQNTGNFGQIGQGDDLGFIATSNVNAPKNAMLIYSDPSEAEGVIFMSGFPGTQAGLDGANGNTLFETSGNLDSGNIVSVLGELNFDSGYVTFGGVQLWRGTVDFAGAGGMSGSGVFLSPSGIPGLTSAPYLAGIYTNGPPLSKNGTEGGGLFEPLSDIYVDLAAKLFDNGPNGLNLNPDSFDPNVLIADQDGYKFVPGVAFDPINTTVEGTGFHEHIYET